MGRARACKCESSTVPRSHNTLTQSDLVDEVAGRPLWSQRQVVIGGRKATR